MLRHRVSTIFSIDLTLAYRSNADLIFLREGLNILLPKLAVVISRLSAFAEKYRDLPTLGFTHFQPAQLTTVGKRATLWIQELLWDLRNLERARSDLGFRGVKGTTGTQGSFLALFDGDHAKVSKESQELPGTKLTPRSRLLTSESRSCSASRTLTPSPVRRTRERLMPMCSARCPASVRPCTKSRLTVSCAGHVRLCRDLTPVRLLANLKEIEEPFEKDQIGR